MVEYGILHKNSGEVTHITQSEYLARKTLDKLPVLQVLLVVRDTTSETWRKLDDR